MFRRFFSLLTCVVLLGVFAAGQTPGSRGAAAKTPLVERVADTGFIQLESASFAALDARQKAVAYWLSQAAVAIDPIIYDQLSRFGLRQKRLLEGIMAASPKPAANIR